MATGTSAAPREPCRHPPRNTYVRLTTALLALALLSGCGAAGSQPIKTNSPETAWRWAGAEVAIVGRPASIAFERTGARVVGSPKRERVTARCTTCVAAAPMQFEVTTPAGAYELDAGIAEIVTAQVVFPVEGTWTFEPLGGQIQVRAGDSTLPPVVVVRRWSAPLAPSCGPAQIEAAISSLTRAFNAGDPSHLATAVSPSVDFSISGAPLGQFVTRMRNEVGDYIRNRHLVGRADLPVSGVRKCARARSDRSRRPFRPHRARSTTSAEWPQARVRPLATILFRSPSHEVQRRPAARCEMSRAAPRPTSEAWRLPPGVVSHATGATRGRRRLPHASVAP